MSDAAGPDARPRVSRRQARSALAYEAVSAGPPPTVLPCQPALCWIEVQVFDEDDRPCAGEPYWIRLPDGAVREGQLDVNGLVRLDDIPCGTCQVKVPAGADGAFSVSTQPAPSLLGWLEIALVDDTGAPVADEPFVVQLPDGDTRDGRLDADGSARLTGIPTGVCRVSFPERHAPDILAP